MAHLGVREVDVAGEAEVVSRFDADAFTSAFDLDMFADAEVATAFAQDFAASFLQKADEGGTAAIEDGDFEVVDFDGGVVDAHAVEDAQQVFGSGDEDALAHEAGGVADALDVLPTSGDLETVEVSAGEDDAGAGRGGKDADGDRDAAVEADAFGLD